MLVKACPSCKGDISIKCTECRGKGVVPHEYSVETRLSMIEGSLSRLEDLLEKRDHLARQTQRLASRLLLVSDIKIALATGRAREAFPRLFKQVIGTYDMDDNEAAKVFDTSIPNVKRWASGQVVPPAAKTVLKIAVEHINRSIHESC